MSDFPFPIEEYTPEEQKRLKDVLQESEEFEQEHDLHPIIRSCIYLCLEENGETWLKELPEDRLDAVKGYLASVHESEPKALPKAVFDLLRVSAFLDHEKKVGMPAYQLFSIANDAVVQFGLLNEVDAVVTEEGRGAHDKLTGGNTVKGAPKLGEEKPEGALTLDDLGARRKL